MNFLLRHVFLLGWLAAVPGLAGAGDIPKSAGVTVFGADSSLVAGAEALRLGQFEEGIRLTLEGLQKIQTGRNRVSGLNNLCAGYVGARQYQKAIEACNAAMEINQNNWRVYNNRALAQLGLGRVAEARRDHAAGLALKPDSPRLGKVHGLIEAQGANTVLAGASSPDQPPQ